jgi:hypothetical protein
MGSSIFFFRLLGKTFYRMITAPAIPSEDKDMAEFFVNLLEGK